VWPEPSRLIPAASKSIRVEVSAGAFVKATATMDRPASPPWTTTCLFRDLPVGTLTAGAWAYPQAGGAGTAQAWATADLPIELGKTTTTRLKLETTVDRVSLAPSSLSLAPGAKKNLTVTAYDRFGATVLMSADKLEWTSSNPTAATVAPLAGMIGAVTGVATGTATVTVRDTESGKQASAPVNVDTGIIVTVDPATWDLLALATKQFSADVANTSDKRVTWSVVEGAAGGTITSGGLYTAPATAGGPYRVKATSVADPTKSGTAAVTVKPAGSVIIIAD